MRKTFRAIIIDDEPLGRQRLSKLISQHEGVVTVVGEAGDGQEGIALIEKLLPDIVFLDIEMPVLSGFEMLHKLTHQAHIIFVTAYDQYAVKAFDENAIDYLLKPVEAARLEKAIRKITAKDGDRKPQFRIEDLISKLQIPEKRVSSLTVRLGDRILLIKANDIIAAEADDKYVSIQTVDGKKHLTDYTLSVLEETLPDNFTRIHRSTIINADHIREIRKGFNGTLTFIMNAIDAPRFKSSRSYGDILKTRFGI